MTRAGALQKAAGAILGASLALPALVAVAPQEAQARKAGVNRPVREGGSSTVTSARGSSEDCYHDSGLS